VADTGAWRVPRQTEKHGQEEILTATESRVEHPPMFRVLLHNDDYTPMDFVVMVLREVFHHEEAQAVRIMLAVHKRGVGVAGIYPFEVAESKVDRVHRLARANEHPFKCSIEEE
jgi:ATP-dependent Clp protease adaptor protein ClpS